MFKPQRIEPKAGQDSVWDYPRPPRIEKVTERLRVVFNGRTIADTRAGYRVLETSHPPVCYLPSKDTRMAFLEPAPGHSWCEFKGACKLLVAECRRKALRQRRMELSRAIAWLS